MSLFFFKQKSAYEMRISDWSSDLCSSDLFRADEVHPIVLNNIAREARLMTDEAKMYKKIGRKFAEHGTTLHGARQYVDYKDRTIHTNKLGRASSRERVCQYVEISGVAESLKKKK